MLKLHVMLTELAIRNFAIIDDLHIRFGSGLNVLTGETGAGKSIIIDAIGLLLGDRASAESIRAGSELAEIEAQFTLSGDAGDLALHALLADNGLDDPDADGWLILSREVRANGRNICRVNGRATSLQLLSDLAARLIDVHGQGEHLNLLRPSTHSGLLDRYAGLVDERRALAGVVSELRTVRGQLDRMRQDARTIAQRVDILSYQADEIERADLSPGEDEDLEGERVRLGNAETLQQLAQSAYAILSEGESDAPSAIDLLGEAVDRVDKLAHIDTQFATPADEAQTVLEQLSDLAQQLQDYADGLEYNPARLAEVEDRLELIHSLKRKYGDTIAEILAYGASATAELEQLGNWEARTEELERREGSLLEEIGRLGMALSEKRAAAGETLAKSVEIELDDLRMEKARFAVSVTQSPDDDGAILPDGTRVAFSSTGLDDVECLISANPGEPLKPMAKVASGGETARLMLALKGVLAHADATPSLVFDEIDQGIGGRVGGVVGRKLWALTGQVGTAPVTSADNGDGQRIGGRHQVLCVTHLPQLAAYGDTHFAVTKRIVSVDGDERTATDVTSLSGDARIDELVLMLGAATESGRQSVTEIMAEAEQFKAGTPASQRARP